MKRYIYGLLGSFFLFSSVAYAEMIRGSITFVDTTNNRISIQPADPGKSSQLLIKMRSDTRTRNVSSIGDLKVGQEVKVDAKQNRQENILEAKSIEVTKSAERASAQYYESQSSHGSTRPSESVTVESPRDTNTYST